MKLAGFLNYTIATFFFFFAGSNLWDNQKVGFSVALPDQMQEIL
jgi:hypothetical protein